MVGEQIGELFLFHLLLLGYLLKDALVVLGCPQVDQHRGVDRAVGQRGTLLVKVSSVDWTLLNSTNARWNNQVKAELTRLHLFLMMVTANASCNGKSVIVFPERARFFRYFAGSTHVQLLKAALA